MNVLQHTRNELNLCLKENRPDRSYGDTLLITQYTLDPSQPRPQGAFPWLWGWGTPPPIQSKGKAPWERSWILALWTYTFILWGRVFGSIWKYRRMQWFSWRTYTVRAVGASVECRRHELLGGSGYNPPREICKIGLSKMQFPAFFGPELGKRKSLLRR